MVDDRDRPLRVVEIDHDFQVTRRRGRRLVHDRDLFLLGTALERVTQAQEPGRDDRARRRASKTVDRSVARIGPVDFAVGRFGFVAGSFRLVPIGALHAHTVCRISGGTIAADLACPWITGG